MTVTPAALALGLVVIAVVIAGSQAWLVALAKLAITKEWLPDGLSNLLAAALRAFGIVPALPLVPFTPRRPVPWALFDIIAIIAIWLIGSAVVFTALRQSGWLHAVQDMSQLSPSETEIFFATNAVVSLLIVAVGALLVAWRTSAAPHDLGWSPAHVYEDLSLGITGFVMLAPPVYALQALMVQFWPSEHPLIESFKAAPSPRLFVLLFFSAAVAAPLFEEFVFRVLLQGFLEKVVRFRGEVHELFFGDLRRIAPPESPVDARGAALAVEQDWNPYAPPRSPDADLAAPSPLECDVLQPEHRGLKFWLPVLASSIVFALMHLPHGPDWIPLTFLAAGMGYLYQRTHRLLPSLIVHILLNSSSLLALWVQVYDTP